MKEPSQFSWKDITNCSVKSTKNHGRVVFKVSDLKNALNNQAEWVDLDLRTSYSGNNNNLNFYFLSLERNENFQKEAERFFLQETLSSLNKEAALLKKEIAAGRFTSSKVLALTQAQNRLREYAENDRIPEAKKRELVAIWKKKVSDLESDINPLVLDKVNQLKQSLNEIEQNIELVQSVLDIPDAIKNVVPNSIDEDEVGSYSSWCRTGYDDD